MTDREATSKAASQLSGSEVPFKIWQCILCGYIYDEGAGCPEDGIAPGTRWHDVPDDWMCPECSAAKGDFEMMEI
ncbi:hypothetical protein CNE_BB1p05950 (plasmid) [Cupriavidus necator N-1]|uniref:Rubredoxin n=1 Tax=Cupriavidus necator (strain ATCC 43291 / DSM 13513 / CCUG 52238 / LMG 8453 / N-1) TaxID=1042878 RepID=F8GXE5_CUPNN|nr:rubredoxin [Cupriavidus necator]AEI82015.1 hypothetical protein CNE_BB1p05950 [Cupriavidus necator N-1]MDX6008333.1 rubredoxin [Cupriavidus necator]